MLKFFSKILGWLIFFGVIIGGLYYAGVQFGYFRPAPCTEPIFYKIAQFDERFGIREADFKSAIEQAIAIWEKPIGKDLFHENVASDEQSGALLAVNLIYDDRQAATIEGKETQSAINSTKQTAENISKDIASLKSQYQTQKAQYESALQSYENAARAYDQRVEYWNAKGGAPRNEYESLNRERTALQNQQASLNEKKDALIALNARINSLIDHYNSLVRTTNVQVAEYNNSGYVGREFDEGVYIYERRGLREVREIDIYEFSDRAKLVRVLAHEFGHALGLDHNENPKSIMYRLNTSANITLTAEDVASLKQVCGVAQNL